ncbi:MAG: hypothetical protein WBA74_01120, partial [Cyclobacteriaceae bacterium]
MKKYNVLSAIFMMVMACFLFSCSTEEEINPFSGDDLSIAEPEATTLNRGAISPSFSTMGYFETRTFTTLAVPGATTYTWTVDDQASRTTTEPSITVQGMYLIWLPP